MGIMLILSPAKRMDEVEGPPYVEGEPRLLDKTALLAERLREMSLAECQGLWGCSDRLARLNYERHQTLDLTRAGTPAAVSFSAYAMPSSRSTSKPATAT